jgi:hypothetical protein
MMARMKAMRRSWAAVMRRTALVYHPLRPVRMKIA